MYQRELGAVSVLLLIPALRFFPSVFFEQVRPALSARKTVEASQPLQVSAAAFHSEKAGKIWLLQLLLQSQHLSLEQLCICS